MNMNMIRTRQRRQDAVTCGSNLYGLIANSRGRQAGHGRNVWGKRSSLVLSFIGAPMAELGETLGRCSK